MKHVVAKVICRPLIALALGYSGSLTAQPYPSRALHVVVPYLPGGGVDTVARLVGQKLGDALGQAVIVDNRPGGAAIIGSEFVARSAPDGYTVLMGSPANAINPALYSKISYDQLKDFKSVTLIGTSPNLLVVHPSLPVATVKDLIALAKSKPGQLTFASAGIASGQHLAGEIFRYQAQIDVVHIPYKGGPQAVTDLIGGEVTMYFSAPPSALPHVRTGRLRLLAVSSAKRSVVAPDVPTIAEAALPDFEYVNWYAYFVPSATPQDIVVRLNAETVKALGMTELRQRLIAEGVDAYGSSPADLDAFIRRELAKNAQLIQRARIRVE